MQAKTPKSQNKCVREEGEEISLRPRRSRQVVNDDEYGSDSSSSSDSEAEEEEEVKAEEKEGKEEVVKGRPAKSPIVYEGMHLLYIFFCRHLQSFF